MHPPYEIVFRDSTAKDVIRKLVDIGCEIELVDERGIFEPRIDSTSDMVTKSIGLSLNGVEPFGSDGRGSFLAWKDGCAECRFVYMPSNAPMTLAEILLLLFEPVIALVDLFRGPRKAKVCKEQQALNNARTEIEQRLEADPMFARSGFISMDEFKTSRNPP